MEDIVYNLLNWQSADLTILACAETIYQLFSRVPLPSPVFCIRHKNNHSSRHT